MSIDDVIRIHLRTLTERESWRADKLPQRCTENVLWVLDDRGLIEFRLWERVEPNPQPFVDPDPTKMVVRPDKYCGWFSPSRQPGRAGDLSAVLAYCKDDPDLATEIRVSEHGKAKSAELEMATLGEVPAKNPQAPKDSADAQKRNKKRERVTHVPRDVETIGRAKIVHDAIYDEIQNDTGKTLADFLRDVQVSNETFQKSIHFKDARDQWESLKDKRAFTREFS